ncbi:hypothetical protein KR94_07420 [Pantoea ananatis]|uniref:hypothetical protein n=1 Tax=Pantoea ananas TaxID=553 RepID=UPI00051D33EE|nr:hypothetical protein [Pantoea ananatis]KGL57054.1 hypothetical protein KR94_07420 [Pantoea ananatis]
MSECVQEAQIHKHFDNALVILGEHFNDGAYTDIEFIFSNIAHRRLTIRLLFMAPSDDPSAAQMMHSMLGDDLAQRLSIQVLSFYDLGVETNPAIDGNPFGKAEGSFDLRLDELHYLYKTIVGTIFRVVDTERIELLFFGADNSKLQRVYDRYIKRYGNSMGFQYETRGAYYAIKTRHYPTEG